MKKLLFLTLTLTSIQLWAQKDVSIQDRIYRLEQKVSGTDNTAELVMEMEKLQQQMNELRGQLEEVNYKINSITEKQKLLYLDVDSRLSELENTKTSNLNTPIDPPSNSVPSPNLTSEIITDPAQTEIGSGATDNSFEEEPKPVNSIEAEQNDYDVAFSHLRAGRFNESARQFESFIYSYPESQLLDNAHYWMGESFYVQRLYPQALSAFQTLAKDFPNSRKLSDGLLKIGYTYYELNDIENAKKHLTEVIKSFPNSSVSRLAQNRLNQIERE